MPETDLQTVTSGVEAALGSTAETAHSFWEKYLGANALSKIIAAAILLIVCVVFIKLLMRLTGRLLEKSKIHTTMHSFIRTLVKLVLVFIAIMLIAGTLGIDTSSLLAIFSIAGLAVSLSVQSALTNMTSAVMLLTSKPYQVGDFVEISGMQGTVREIGILSTKLVTIDGRLISIPNSQAVSGSITNFSTEEDRRVVLSVSASYDDDIEKVTRPRSSRPRRTRAFFPSSRFSPASAATATTPSNIRSASGSKTRITGASTSMCWKTSSASLTRTASP